MMALIFELLQICYAPLTAVNIAVSVLTAVLQ